MVREPFRGVVPTGLLYDTGHDMWVRREGAEVARGRPLAWAVEQAGLVDAAAHVARAPDPAWLTLVF